MDSQTDLFGPAPISTSLLAGSDASEVGATLREPSVVQLAARLNPRVRLGTSSWYFPGWAGIVFDVAYRKEKLVKHGLAVYARHPLLRTVSLDRSFYRPLPADEYRLLAAQVPDDFRFIVKAWSGVTDATLRASATGQPTGANPLFLDAAAANEHVVAPAAEGLDGKLGALVFQLSPLPVDLLGDPGRWLARLATFLDRLERPSLGVLALELRDAALLTPGLAAVLKAAGVRYCLGLHDRMPGVDEQLPVLRALWPGPLVCRWNLQRGLRYAQAKSLFEPFDRLAAPDLPTRKALAHIAAATAAAGEEVLIAINNKAEGSAPRSVRALAEQIDATQAPPVGASRRPDQ